MGKLKFIKSVVAVLTFLLIFGLLSVCGSIVQKVLNHHPQAKEISLNLAPNENIADFKVTDTNLYILTTDRKIKVIDTKSGDTTLTISTH